LKVKKKSLLVVIAILSVLLAGIGTSYAVYGVPDDVPGQDLVWPFICTKTAGTPAAGMPASSIQTNWAIANLSSKETSAHCSLWSKKSQHIIDFQYDWTGNGVVVDDCNSFLAAHPSAKTSDLDSDGIADLFLSHAQIIPGNAAAGQGDYWAGYITCSGEGGNIFMNNLYLVDPTLGFSSGFNGPSEEDGAGAGSPGISSAMGENNGSISFTAHDLFLRYYVNNDDASFQNTWDWWIVLASRNQYTGIARTSTRSLNGDIWDENEHFQSINIPIPNELNIINASSYFAGAPMFEPVFCPHPGDPLCVVSFPKAGYIDVSPTENGTTSVPGDTFAIVGTCNDPSGQVGGVCQSFYSIFAWSYERAQASSVLADFDVIHPAFRTYCSGGGGLARVARRHL